MTVLVSLQLSWWFCYIGRISRELEKEAQMHKLQHPNIVEVHAIISEHGRYGIVMEYVHHGALDNYIHGNDV